MKFGRPLRIVSGWVLSFLMVVPQVTLADTNPNTKSLKESYSKLKAGGPGLESYVNTMKDDLTQDQYKFFLQKAQENKTAKVQLTYSGDKIYVEQDGARVGIGVTNAEKGIFNINNKSVTIEDSDTPQILWDKLSLALPQTSASILDVVLPKAHAVAPLVIAGVIVLGGLAIAYTKRRTTCGRWEAVKRTCEFANKKLADDSDALDRVMGLDVYIQGAYSNLGMALNCPGDKRRADAEKCVLEMEATVKKRPAGEAFLSLQGRAVTGKKSNSRPGAADNR